MVEVKLHDIGEGMTEGDVLAYFIQEEIKLRKISQL